MNIKDIRSPAGGIHTSVVREDDKIVAIVKYYQINEWDIQIHRAEHIRIAIWKHVPIDDPSGDDADPVFFASKWKPGDGIPYLSESEREELWRYLVRDFFIRTPDDTHDEWLKLNEARDD